MGCRHARPRLHTESPTRQCRIDPGTGGHDVDSRAVIAVDRMVVVAVETNGQIELAAGEPASSSVVVGEGAHGDHFRKRCGNEGRGVGGRVAGGSHRNDAGVGHVADRLVQHV